MLPTQLRGHPLANINNSYYVIPFGQVAVDDKEWKSDVVHAHLFRDLKAESFIVDWC